MGISTKNLDTPATTEVKRNGEHGSGISKAFLANFVHQVVNPLNGVVGTLDNVVDGTYSGDDGVKKINQCRAQVEQCVTLIRNLAYLSEYFGDDSPSSALKPVRTDAKSVLPQVLIEALQFFQVSAARKNIKLNVTESRNQYKIRVRPELLKQVFINLFDNWVKYGTQGTTIEVSPRITKKGILLIEMTGASIGFDKDENEIIFEMGKRAANAENKIAQGSGIGLFICEQIITRELNGQISAQHNYKSGITTFSIKIPEDKWEL